MFLNAAKISNIRSIRNITWSIPTNRSLAEWHVIVGDNGSGKTSFLRAIALALVGPTEAQGLRQA
jgi:DNA repair exonuclease SbcCD ATPase subunit